VTQSYIYRSPTTPGGPGWTEDLGDAVVRAGRIAIGQQAEQGQSYISSLVIDDPDADVGHDGDAITGLKQFDWDESAAPSGNQRIFTGYIGKRTYRRGSSGESPSLIQESARVIEVELYDINAFLSFRRFTPEDIDATSSFNRPAETDLERIAALLDVDFLSDTLFDGLVSTSGAVNLDANDYSRGTPADVLDSCAQQSGKNYFVIYDEAGDYGDAGNFVLFYDFNDSPVYLSDMQVSNLLADVDNETTWAPNMDAVLDKDPTRIVTRVLMDYSKGTVLRELATTANTYAWRDAVSSAPELKTSSAANTRSDRYLLDNSTEDERITFSVQVPKENVNDWKAGQAGQVKFTHLPGYEDFRYVRALRRTVSQDEETDEFYNIEYECTPMQSTPSGAFDQQEPGVSYSGIPTLPRPTTPGNILFAIMFASGFTAVYPTSFRALDSPPLFPASPPVPPYSALQTANWTVIASATTDYTGMNIGGTGSTAGFLVAAAWRYVQPGEVTVNPSAFSTEDNNSECAVYLWELPTTTPPSGSFVATSNQHNTNPATPSLASISGNVVAAFYYATSGGHSTGFSGGNPTAGSATSPGVILRQAWQNGVTGNSNQTDFTTPNTMDFGQLILLPTGGVPAASVTPGVPGSVYAHLNSCGIAVELPTGITLPDIPYPANQSA